MDRPLPNDECPETKRLELEFVERNRLQPYDDTEPTRMCGIILSRALGSSYVWPEDAPPLTVEHFKDFSTIGHTMGFDYRSMYARNLALDLDCVCRVNPRTMVHLNEALVTRITKTAIETVVQTFNVPCKKSSPASSPTSQETIPYMIWRKKCGFHVYFDFPISLESHLLIGKILKAKFATDDVCIEVPRVMPLPYSAKKRNEPYIPLLPTQQTVPLLPIFDDGYHSVFEYSQAFSKNLSCVKITTKVGDFYCNQAYKPKRKFGNLQIKYIKSVTLMPEHKHMEELLPFINRMALATEKDIAMDLDLRNDIEADSVWSRDEELMSRFTDFMARFNKKFTDDDSITYNTFINFALLSHRGLYLQHYIVLLHKSLEPISDDDMREILRKIFNGLADPLVNRFIRYYDNRTLNCYSDSAKTMMEHLHFLYSNDVSPFHTVNEQLDALLQAGTCEESPTSFQRSLQDMDNASKKKAIQGIIKMYCRFVIEMRVVMYNVSSSNYYVLCDLGTHYKISTKPDNYPTIFNWIGNSKASKEAVYGEMDIIRSQYSITQTELLSRCKFQISTSTGVFNSVIGLYTAKSRFLRFLCYRDTAIWELDDPRVMHSEQNYKLLDRLAVVEPYVKMMFDNIEPLFVHFVLAPAFIQLLRIHQIEEYQISALIHILARYPSLQSAHFLVEYFPIDPKFIFVIMHIYMKCDNFNTLERYQTMIDHIFHVYDTTQIDPGIWTSKFDPIVAEMKYTEKATYMETLLTIDHPDVNNVSEDFCLYAVLLAVCFIKCQAYATMCQAFGVTKLPKPKSEHSEYKKDFVWDTSLQASTANMHRAIRIIFPRHHDKFEKNLILCIFVICMSTYFDPETTRDLVTCISSIFLSSNVRKKCFIMYGKKSGTGKSLFSDILQMLTSPKVGRYTSLGEAMERANVTLKNNVIIINEMKSVDGDKIKAVTGNDAESTKQFYSQEYEMHTNQSLIFGATNSIIEFKNNSYIDQVSVRRFHVVKLCGQQMLSDFKSSSMFSMMTNMQLHSGTMKPTECEVSNLANGVGWLSFVSYVLYRDENLYPKINIDSACNREYSELVYRSNNKLYDFLVNNGIMVAPGFHMRAERFINLVKVAIRSAKTDLSVACPFASFHEFKRRFENTDDILVADGTVQDYQEIGLVHHIRRNMSVSECPDALITRDDIVERTAVYSDIVDRENAESYFARENKDYYSHADGVYRNIEFVQLPLSYEHNVMSDGTGRNEFRNRLDVNV